MLHGDPQTIRFGINYTPSRYWYYCWNDWDVGSIRSDFDAMATLGVDHVRIQLIWPYFQPNPTFVSPGHLRRLEELMRIAEDRGMDVLVTVLTGFLSGYVFLPPKVSPRGVFTDEAVGQSQRLLFHRLLETIGDRSNFMGFDLGNEINCLDHDLPAADGDAWATALIEAVRPAMRHGWIVNGVDYTPWFSGSTFSLEHLGCDYDAISLHTWPKFTGCLERGEADEAPSIHMPAFLCQLARLYRREPRQPVWVQEFGCCDLWAEPQRQQRYMRESIEHAVAAGAGLLTWWCSHDKDGELKFIADEYRFGLFDTANAAKPLAGVYREMIEQYAHQPVRQPATEGSTPVPVPSDFRPRMVAEVPPRHYIQQALATSTWQLYDAWLAVLARGERPMLVCETERG